MKTRYPALDVLRALCALAVFAFHAQFLFRLNGSMQGQPLEVAQYGYLGVPVFFMISGFVICLSAERANHTSFLIGRVSRLMPTFWLCLALTVAVLALVGALPSVIQIAANLLIAAPLFGQSYIDAVYWSLVVEILFYAVIWTLLGDSFKRRLRIFAIVWLALSAVNLVWQLPAQILLNPLWGPFFCIGIFAYLQDRRWLTVSVLLGTASSYVLALGYDGRGTSPEVAALITVALGALFPVAVKMQIPDWAVKPAAIAGMASYPLYLLHAEIGVAIAGLIPAWPVLIIAVSLVLGAAEPRVRRYLRSFESHQ